MSTDWKPRKVEPHGRQYRVFLGRENGKKLYRYFEYEDEANLFAQYGVVFGEPGTTIRMFPQHTVQLTSRQRTRATPTFAEYAWSINSTPRDRKLRDSSIRVYRQSDAKIRNTPLGHTPVDQVTLDAVRAFVGKVGLTGQLHQYLNKAFTAASDEGLLPRNPLKVFRMRRPASRRREFVPLTVDEVETFAENAATVQDGLCILLGGICGLRASEIGGLRPQDVHVDPDDDDCYLTIRQAATNTSGNRKLDDPKTRTSTRRVPVDCELATALSDFIASAPPNSHGTIFMTGQRGLVTYASLNDVLRVASRKSGIRYVSSHKLRHTAASNWMTPGSDSRLSRSSWVTLPPSSLTSTFTRRQRPMPRFARQWLTSGLPGMPRQRRAW